MLGPDPRLIEHLVHRGCTAKLAISMAAWMIGEIRTIRPNTGIRATGDRRVQNVMEVFA